MTAHQLAKLLMQGPDLPVRIHELLPDLTMRQVDIDLAKAVRHARGEAPQVEGYDGVKSLLIRPAEPTTAWEGKWRVTKVS